MADQDHSGTTTTPGGTATVSGAETVRVIRQSSTPTYQAPFEEEQKYISDRPLKGQRQGRLPD